MTTKLAENKLEEYEKELEKHKSWLKNQRGTPNFQNQESPAFSLSPRKNDLISPSSKKSRSEKSKREEALLAKGKEYQQHRKELADKYAKEQSYKFRPKITKLSKSLQRDGQVTERLFQVYKMREENLDKARQELESEIKEKYNFKPSISSKAKSTSGREDVASVNQEWIQQKEAKLEQKRREAQEEERGQLSDPALSKGTMKIIDRIKTRQKEKMPPEDNLINRQQQAQQAFWDKIETEYREKNPGTPRITPAAAKIQRTGEVSDRLYQLSFELKDKKEQLVQEQLAQEKEQFQFKPRVNHSEIERIFPTEDDYWRRRIERTEIPASEDTEKSEGLYRPQLNPVSEEIAARLPQKTRDRLFQPKMNTMRGFQDPSCTFSPRINDRSRELSTEKEDQRDIVQDLYSKEQKRRERLEALRKEMEESELKECTFSPRKPGSTEEKSESEYEKKLTARGTNIIDRARKWKKKREEKLRYEREESIKKEMAECTFQPNIIRERDNLSETLDSIQTDDSEIIGFDEFVERQELARRKRQEAEKSVFTTGDSWRPRRTTPKEPKLGRSKLSSSALKALSKPMSPPSFKDQSNLSLTQEWTQVEAETPQLPPSGVFSRHATPDILSQCNVSEIEPVNDENTVDSLSYDTRHKSLFSISFNHLEPSAEWMKRREEKYAGDDENLA
eukprot:gb/GECH01013083.1/.p1 GENE.gb/GECH01013083.1/~~gb/GECH01013083.1/.p1  ORF type:complete len:677 (+),score=182.43 gb/GECH01013083.1/:1-2031(+)